MEKREQKVKLHFVSLVIFSGLTFAPIIAVANTDFDPGLLVADEAFGNYQAFASADGIQRFLEVRGSMLADSSIEFLRKLKEPADLDLKNRLEDPRPNLGRLRSAAELIFDAASLSKINPQVLLVTLQKEQSLIDGKFSDPSVLQKRLDRALGFACPDNGSCGEQFLGFYYQLFGSVDKDGNRFLGASRSLAKSYYTEVAGVRVGRGPMVDAQGNTFGSASKVRTSRAGDTIVVDNTQGPPNNALATSQVTLKNAATAALYRYTPHVYNGNYNFWRFFRQWFKFGNGSLVKLSGDDQVYFIDNGQRRPVSGTVLTLRKLDVTAAFTISQTEAGDYPEAKPLPPPEGTLISPSTGGVRYLVEESKLRKLSDFIAGIAHYDTSKTIFLPDFEVNAYEVGEPALPSEGTLLRSVSAPVVYIVAGKTLRPISGFVFGQRKYSFSDVIIGPDAELAGFAKSAPLPPQDGTLAKTKASPLVYYVALGQKYPIPGFVFKLRKYKFSNVVTLGDDELENLALAGHLTPADGTLIKAKGNPTVYLVEAGSLHYVSGFMFSHRGYKGAAVVEVGSEELALIPQNSPLVLENGSLVKAREDPTVYLLVEGQKRALSYEAFLARKFKFSAVIEMPAEEIQRYLSGNPISQ
ncbi:MAG: hypothetical protein HY397_02045 [Candidatus Doudnabacteria bacterium]|nr:hypothetical protein [Candidatus Doudnabacteria bacterium]